MSTFKRDLEIHNVYIVHIFEIYCCHKCSQATIKLPKRQSSECSSNFFRVATPSYLQSFISVTFSQCGCQILVWPENFLIVCRKDDHVIHDKVKVDQTVISLFLIHVCRGWCVSCHLFTRCTTCSDTNLYVKKQKEIKMITLECSILLSYYKEGKYFWLPRSNVTITQWPL